MALWYLLILYISSGTLRLSHGIMTLLERDKYLLQQSLSETDALDKTKIILKNEDNYWQVWILVHPGVMRLEWVVILG